MHTTHTRPYLVRFGCSFPSIDPSTLLYYANREVAVDDGRKRWAIVYKVILWREGTLHNVVQTEGFITYGDAGECRVMRDAGSETGAVNLVILITLTY